MADKRRTHKGREIDVDLIRMKHELELKEINNINIKREKEIDGKRRRGDNSSKISEMLANQESVRQKLREQKLSKKDAEEDTSSDQLDVKTEIVDDVEKAEDKPKKETPEVLGRRVVAKR